MKSLRFWPWLAAVLSGLLLTLCFPRWNQAWLCWFALVPLVTAVWFGPRVSRGRAFGLGYVFGLFFFWGVFFWLTAVSWMGNEVILGWALLPLYLALFPACWALFLGSLRPWVNPEVNPETAPEGGSDSSGNPKRKALPNLAALTLGAAAWTALDWLRGLGALSFGWNGLGVVLHQNPVLIQLAEWTGIGGLSFLIAFTNLTLASFIARLFLGKTGRLKSPPWCFVGACEAICLLLLVGAHLLGMGRLSKWEALAAPGASPDPVPLSAQSAPNTLSLRVAAVQANIPQAEKFDPEYAPSVRERYQALSEAALAAQPQLLIWPEAATPASLFSSKEDFEFVLGFARKCPNFLFGSIDIDPNEKNPRDYNIAALFTQGGESMQIYKKIHLVPFGEYLPLRKQLPFLEWIVGETLPGDYTPGDDYTLLQLEAPNLTAAALICFEDTLGNLTRQFVRRGAQLLVNLTNDGWFLESAGSEQHLANARFRAVENRRPLLRVANTGVTAFISPGGRVIKHLCDPQTGSTFTEGVLVDTLAIPAPGAPQTFYTRHGELFSQTCAGLAFLAVLTLVFRRKATFSPVLEPIAGSPEAEQPAAEPSESPDAPSASDKTQPGSLR